MLFKSKRFIAFLVCAIMILALQINSSAVIFASEDTSTTESTSSTESTTSTTSTTASTTGSTTTTTKPASNGVQVSQIYCYGSNTKLYNQVIKYSEIADSYTANVSIPMWMESCQINIKSVSGATVTYDGKEFSANGSVYSYTFEFDAATKYKTTTYKIKIKKGDKESTVIFNLSQSVFETKLESVSVDSNKAEGSNADGYKYTLPEGTTSCKIKIKTRSEEKVTLGRAGEEAKEIEISPDKVFLEKVTLTEGENVFNITVSAPGTTISTVLTVTVGEPVLSSDVVSSDIPDEEDTPSDSDIPGYIEPDIPESSDPEISSIVSAPVKSDNDETSPLIWILIGVVIAIVIGACIFMIASMGGKSSHPSNSGRGYGGPYRAPVPPPARRRDLGRYVEDDYGYDDYYEEQPDDGYYQDDGYYEDDGYYQNGDYYDDYGPQGSRDTRPPQRYDRQPPRQQYQSQRRGNRNDFDDFYDDYYN